MKYKAKVHITLKKGILDIQGNTIQNALHSIGFEEVDNMHIGKYMEFTIKTKNESTAKKRVDTMCRKLLANPVIEDFNFTLTKIKGEKK
ncbi:MAG: phosphoribosylformylglycinamidine synthase subunit PurS [Armatimonadota bacterium]